jgi:phosphoserine phosphatase
MMRSLHVFDMDGTLLVGSACLEISRTVGVLDETLAIENAWARGELSDNGFWQHCLPLWAGLTDAQIDAAFANSPWLHGVEAVFADIRTRGEASVVITQSPAFFVERLMRWGVNFVHGALVEPGNAGGAERLVSAADKLAVTARLLDDLRLSLDDCVVYGDSSSDLALFETLPLSVAVNAKERIRALARTTYDGPDLWQAYCSGRRLLDLHRVRDGEIQNQGVSL